MKLLYCLLCYLLSMPAFARPQTLIKGVLPNGLTYYIMHNDNPSGQADFFLVQRTGSVQERENERGLAHFLEHMAFNGSQHFPGNAMISYLESIGVKFGADLNAYTSTDETVYNICRVPVTRESSLDSCLLILRDWSTGLSLNDSDINAERGVIEGEWRHRSAASNRILEKLLPEIYPGSIYGKRMPIGLMSVVRNFKPATLRNFYHRWHKPENQAVVIVGDFEVSAMEHRVRQMFSDVSLRTASKGDTRLPAVADNRKILVAIGSDPEQGNNVLQLHFKHKVPQLSGEAYWRRKAGEWLLGSLLAERFDSLEQLPECPWQNLGVGVGKYLMSRGVNSLVMRGRIKEGREKEAFQNWYAEILRVLDYGFSAEEMDEAKREYVATLTRRKRKDITNSDYARRWSRHFLDGGPLVSVEAEIDSLLSVVEGMTPEYCSELLATMADRKGSGSNMVVVAMRPQNSPALSKKDFCSSLELVNEMELQPYSIQPVVGSILRQEPEAGTITTVDTVLPMECRFYVLGNGIRVYAKKTDFKKGQVYVVGSGPGGFSQRYAPELANEMKMLNDVMPLCQYGDYSQSKLRRLLNGKEISIKVQVENNDESVQFSAGRDDLEDAFRVMYLKLTDVKPDKTAFTIWQSSAMERLAGARTNPVQLMGDSIHGNVYNHHPLGMKETPATVAALNLDTIVSLYKDRFADLSDFTFYVTGDFAWPELEKLLQRYVASLPAMGRIERPKDIDYRYAQGRRDIDFRTPMQTPVAIMYCFLNGPATYDIKNYLIANIAGSILKNRLLKTLREERGWTYSVTGHCAINPDLNGNDAPSFLWPVYIKSAPEHAAATRNEVEEAFNELVREAPSVEELDKVRNYLQKNFKEGLEDNGFWLSALQKYNDYGLNFAADYLPVLKSITPEDIRRFTAEAIKANRIRLSLTPQ